MIEPVSDAVTLVTADGHVGTLIRLDPSLGRHLTPYDEMAEDFIWLQDVVDENKFPYFHVLLSNVHYAIDHQGKSARSVNPARAYFRFETGDVHKLAMVQNGVPWRAIRERYVVPSETVMSVTVSDKVLGFVIDVAFGVLTKFLLKI